MSEKINQSHVRKDPASKNTDFPDQREADQTKQPGNVPSYAGDNGSANPAPGKYNIRDIGEGEAVSDAEVRQTEGRASDKK